MNIFVLDENPQVAAKMHNDKHVVKMILESAQLLCGVHHMTDPLTTEQVPYKLSHNNHPCSIWARQCVENYIWLCDLGLALCEEYTYRYGKRHKSQDIIEWCLINEPNLKENGDITPFALAMPDECKTKTAVESYRLYYLTHKRDMSTWKNRKKPEWFI